MKKNIITLVVSIIVTLAWLFGAPKLPFFQCEGLVCGGVGFVIVFIALALIPIIFGILGYVFSKENRLKQAFYSFGISLLVSAVIIVPQIIMGLNESKLKAEQDIQDAKARYEANPEQYKQRPY